MHFRKYEDEIKHKSVQMRVIPRVYTSQKRMCEFEKFYPSREGVARTIEKLFSKLKILYLRRRNEKSWAKEKTNQYQRTSWNIFLSTRNLSLKKVFSRSSTLAPEFSIDVNTDLGMLYVVFMYVSNVETFNGKCDRDKYWENRKKLAIQVSTLFFPVDA